MKVYVALVDTWRERYGCEWNLVGVYDDFEKAREELDKYEEYQCYTKIISVDINENAHKYIGGYVE